MIQGLGGKEVMVNYGEDLQRMTIIYERIAICSITF